MKIQLQENNELLIQPETEFEKQFLSQNYFGTSTCFLKHGFSGNQVVGLKIQKSEEKNAKLAD
jgi:hypothetical protein